MNPHHNPILICKIILFQQQIRQNSVLLPQKRPSTQTTNNVVKQQVVQPPKATEGGQQPPQFVQVPQSQAVKAGDKAIIIAKAIGQPIPTLNWVLENGQALPKNPRKFKIDSLGNGHSQLTILQVTESDLGTFGCVARNTVGEFEAQFLVEFPRVSGKLIDKL